MSPTCNSKSKTVLVALCAAVGFLAGPAMAAGAKSKGELEAPVAGSITVSDYQFNTFIFPSVIKRIFFPAGSPVVGKPNYLGDNSQVMLQFAKGNGTPVQMVTELDTGQVVSLNLVVKHVPGINYSVNGAKARIASAKRVVQGEGTSEAAAPRGEDIELLKALVSTGQPPSGYDVINLPAPTRFDKFSVVPLAGWSDGATKRILVFSLVAVPGQTAVVSPPQFYRPGITAVMVDGDVVDANTSPQLFVVEELKDE